MLRTFPHYYRILRQVYFKQKIDTAITYMKGKYWSVKIGKGLRCIGLPKFRNPPGSTIQLGDRVKILSSFSSNLHGLNRKTMISCLTRKAQITIGDDVGMSGLIIACAEKVTIGSRVLFGANTTISDTDSHAIDYKYRYPSHYGIDLHNFVEPVKTNEVVIEDDVFIGMFSLILKGTHIGKGSVIAAGSIVTGVIPPNVIAAGQPAKIIKHLE